MGEPPITRLHTFWLSDQIGLLGLEETWEIMHPVHPCQYEIRKLSSKRWQDPAQTGGHRWWGRSWAERSVPASLQCCQQTLLEKKRQDWGKQGVLKSPWWGKRSAEMEEVIHTWHDSDEQTTDQEERGSGVHGGASWNWDADAAVGLEGRDGTSKVWLGKWEGSLGTGGEERANFKGKSKFWFLQ